MPTKGDVSFQPGHYSNLGIFGYFLVPSPVMGNNTVARIHMVVHSELFRLSMRGAIRLTVLSRIGGYVCVYTRQAALG